MATSLRTNQLFQTPMKDEDGVFVDSMNKWILLYDGMTLPRGDIHTAQCVNLMKMLGMGYQIQHGWNVQMQASPFNKHILTLVDEITSAGNAAIYTEPEYSKCHLSTNGATSTLVYSPPTQAKQLTTKVN